MSEVFRVEMTAPRLIGSRHYEPGEVVETDEKLAGDIVSRGDGRFVRPGMDSPRTATAPAHGKAAKSARRTGKPSLDDDIADE